MKRTVCFRQWIFTGVWIVFCMLGYGCHSQAGGDSQETVSLSPPTYYIDVLYYKNHYYYADTCTFIGSADESDLILGTYLGEIQETSYTFPSDWKTDFADLTGTSGISGPVYEMKGYDPAFRLCRISGSDAEKIFFVYECFDAFPLRYGEDLYGRLMHVKENQKALKGRFQEEELAFPPGWNAFLDSLYSAPFQPVPENKPYGSVPLRILMKDKTQVELHLYENGWIEYQNQYVHMEGEIFGEIFAFAQKGCI